MEKTRQQKIDDRAITEHKAVGADNPGGQDKIDSQRFVPNVQDHANHLPRKSVMGPIANPYKEEC